MGRGQSGGNMNSVQANFCTKVTRKIYDYSLSSFFRQPVNPKEDYAEDYFDKIKKPMDLGTVLQNLKDGKYQNIDQWKNDMNLIWKNAMTYNNPMSPIYVIAHDLSEMFKKKIENIPKTTTEEWIFSLRKEHKRLLKIINCKPHDIDITDSSVPKPKVAKIVLK